MLLARSFANSLCRFKQVGILFLKLRECLGIAGAAWTGCP